MIKDGTGFLIPLKQKLLFSGMFFIALSYFGCYAHSLSNHIAQLKQVFNGYDGQSEVSGPKAVSFHRYYERFSFELDVSKRKDKETLCWFIREALRKEYNCDVLHGGNHRAYGHMWIMGNQISKEDKIICRLEQEHNGAVAVLNEEWNKFCERHYCFARRILNLQDHKVRAFSSIVHCVHLLGDLEPGNRRTDLVSNLKILVDEISKQAKELFGKEKGDEIGAALKKASKVGANGRERAKSVMNKLIDLKLGTLLHEKHGKEFENKMGCKWCDTALPDMSKSKNPGRSR